MSEATQFGDRPAAKGLVQPNVPGFEKGSRSYPIDIEHLIVHKYSEREALLRKADKVVRELIHSDLRDGELLQHVSAGKYRLLFPNLRPDAAELRGSVIAEKLYRAIRELNPATKEATGKISKPDQSIGKSTARGAGNVPAVVSARPSALSAKPKTREERDEEEKKLAANHAIMLMSTSVRTKAEEAFATPAAKALIADIKIRFQPTWNFRAGAITGYCATATDSQGCGNSSRYLPSYGFSSIEEGQAVLDAVVYKHATTCLADLLDSGEDAVMAIPMHYSTVDHARYVGAFLDACADRLKTNSSRIVLQVQNFPADLSRYRLREWISYLKGRARALNAYVNPLQEGFKIEHYREAGFIGLGIDLNECTLHQRKMFSFLEEFAEACELQHVYSCARGIDSFSKFSAAFAAGFQYMNGPAVAPSLPLPRGIISYDVRTMAAFHAKRWHTG